MADVVLVLGDGAGAVTFTGFEVPERIPFGGDQVLKTHKLVGGARVIDAMGRDDCPLEWTGRFLGPDALSRARAVDAMRIAGKAVTLSWSELAYTVVIHRFVADFQRDWDLPYSITCEVVADLAAPRGAVAGPSIDEMTQADLTSALNLGDQIADPTLSSNLGDLQAAMGAVPSFAVASRSTVSTVTAPLVVAQAQVSALIGSTGGAMIDTSLGGVVPGGDPLTMAATLTAQTAAATEIAPLYDLRAVLARLSINLAAVSSAGQSITVAGGDLYGLAVEKYGDQDAWADIARANGLVDPMLSGVTTLVLPATASNSGGVLAP